MKKCIALVLSLLLSLSVLSGAFAAQEDVTGRVGIYTSMYQFVIEKLDRAIREEFPNLEPAFDGSFFFYGGASSLITKVYGEMETGVLGCDMMLLAEPAFSLELQEKGWLEPIEIEGAEGLFRFPYDPDGYWYPVRVCNMILACNPDKAEDWAARGVNIPKTFHDFACDPTLKGLISMGDPLKSGTTLAAVSSLIQDNHYGEAYLDALAANQVMVSSGSGSSPLEKLQTGECACIMVLEEAVLKTLKEAEDAGAPLTSLACIYPEDGVVLIPSNMMTVAEARSANANIDACEALESWLISPAAQKIILEGYMHSVLSSLPDYPWHSLPTEQMMQKDLGVDWERIYRQREAIHTAWTVKVTNR